MNEFNLLPNVVQAIVIFAVFLALTAICFFVFLFEVLDKGRRVKIFDDNSLMFEVSYFYEQGKRQYQEDSFYISPLEEIPKNGLVVAVADGMGGLQYGDVISKRIVSNIEDWFPFSFFATDSIASSIRKLSNEIYDEYKHEGGSTLVIVNIEKNYMNYYSVGDSNIILVRDGVSTILNQKQNYLNVLINNFIKQGKLTHSANADVNARALTDFMGNINPHVNYTNKPFRLIDGDTLIVCSDGVTDAIKWKEIADLIDNSSVTTALNIKHKVKSRKNPKQDNYTGIVIRVKRNLYD